MSTDDRIDAAITTALGEVAADTTGVSDEQLWDAITAQAAPPASNRQWHRPVLLAAASVAAIALVVGVAVARGDGGDGDSELDVVDDPSTTVEQPVIPPAPMPQPSVPLEEPTEDQRPFVGPDSRPMVVVSDGGSLVTAYFSDGGGPITYRPTSLVRHAELGPDGTLWVTSAGGCIECGLMADSTLVNVDPATGEVLSEIPGAGFASVSPDGTQLAHAQYDPNAVVIRPLDAIDDDGYELFSHDPDGSVENHLWPLGQIQWSPDGTRLLVEEFWEDDIVWLVDLESDSYVGDGAALSLGGADWISDDRLLGTQYCCYGDGGGEEPRHLVEVDLTGDEPVFIDRDELSAGIVGVAPGGLDAAVHVVGDEFDPGPLVRVATGDVIAEDVVSVQW